ncbi:MAG: glycosyltransferase [Candidatus Roizmanbacteria bacterium]|nr:glycosyltransferase [Candidatus Roizmanbacteria bacterium]
MKILYIACGSGSDPTMGGSLLRTVEVAKKMSIKGNILLLTTSGGKKAAKKYIQPESFIEIKTNVSKSDGEKFHLLKLFVSYLLLFIKIPNAISKIPHVDIVYLDSDGIWDIIPGLLYKLRNKNVKIISMNHHIISIRKDNLAGYYSSIINVILQKIGQYLIAKIADGIFILDTDMGGEISRLYIKIGYRGTFYKVRNGIDFKCIENIPKQSIKYDACFFGYLRPSKGLHQIVPIWKKVVAFSPHAKLVIIGGMMESYKRILLEEIKKESLTENIILTNYLINKNDAIKLVKSSKICISPSQEEGWGIAIIECMAAQLPCVVWDLSTFSRILNKGVIKIKKYDKTAFSDEILHLIKNDAERIRFGKEAKISVEKYDWANIAMQDFKYYNEVILL